MLSLFGPLRTGLSTATNGVAKRRNPGAQKQKKVANPNKINRVWFDHVAVATKYIGPIAAKKAKKTKATPRLQGRYQ